jgi:hypothetical protein
MPSVIISDWLDKRVICDARYLPRVVVDIFDRNLLGLYVARSLQLSRDPRLTYECVALHLFRMLTHKNLKQSINLALLGFDLGLLNGNKALKSSLFDQETLCNFGKTFILYLQLLFESGNALNQVRDVP